MRFGLGSHSVSFYWILKLVLWLFLCGMCGGVFLALQWAAHGWPRRAAPFSSTLNSVSLGNGKGGEKQSPCSACFLQVAHSAGRGAAGGAAPLLRAPLSGIAGRGPPARSTRCTGRNWGARRAGASFASPGPKSPKLGQVQEHKLKVRAWDLRRGLSVAVPAEKRVRRKTRI